MWSSYIDAMYGQKYFVQMNELSFFSLDDNYSTESYSDPSFLGIEKQLVV